MIRTIRLWVSRNIGFFVAPVGEWEAYHYRMRRLCPSGDYEYRPMTEAEAEQDFMDRAW